MAVFQKELSERTGIRIEYLLIILTSMLPVFFDYPYRINLFLAWEGAYRVSIGQIPYRDFGSPVGYGFWLVPALFFKIFGPFVHTLLIAQAAINIVSGLAFRKLLQYFGLNAGARLVPLVIYVFSYSMFNFWPWYNHLVFVVELLGIVVLVKHVLSPIEVRKLYQPILASFIIAFAFLTKQDTGALGLFFALFVVILDFVYIRQFTTALGFIGGYVASILLLIVPFMGYDFGYWFNMGQYPHYARVDKFDLINEFLGASEFIKFYLFVVVLLFLIKINSDFRWKDHKQYLLMTLITVFVLGQASIIQVTSYTPIDGNIYFHSFAIAFIIFQFKEQFQFSKIVNLVPLCLVICVWWSGVFWSRFLKEKVQKALVNTNKHNVISKNTYLLSNADSSVGPKVSSRSKWVVSKVPSFKKIRIPQNTEDGIRQIMALPAVSKKGYKMLNMSELTPLAYDMGYSLEAGPQYPLWFHRGVAFFDREVNMFKHRIENKAYDIVLFEDIPNVNQFYPYELRDCLQKHYRLKFKFLAPRVPEISYIEVYTKE